MHRVGALGRCEEKETGKIITDVSAPTLALDWRSLYDANAPDLLRFLRRFTKEAGAAEDLLHDTFARAMGARRLPRPEEARPWLYRIAANVAISDLRRPRVRSSLLFFGVQPSSEVSEVDQVRRALHSIPPDEAVTLTLVLHDGFSRREAAEILGVSEEAVKSRVTRGRLNFIAAYRRLERGLRR